MKDPFPTCPECTITLAVYINDEDDLEIETNCFCNPSPMPELRFESDTTKQWALAEWEFHYWIAERTLQRYCKGELRSTQKVGK